MNEEELESALERIERVQASASFRVWDVLTKFGVAATLGLLAWQWSQERTDRDHGERLRVIESTRFTAREAGDLERRLKEELPPAWLREIVGDLRAGQTEIRDRLSRVEAAVSSNEGNR